MALTYIGTTGIFTHIGSLIKQVNLLATVGSDSDTARAAIQAIFEAGAIRPPIAGLPGAYDAYKSGIVNLRTSLAGMANLRLTDLTTVVQVLNLPDSNLTTVLPALIAAMNTDTASVNRSTVSIGSLTTPASNVGTGTVISSKVLDGVTSPGRGLPACLSYLGLDSEMSITDSFTLTCVADSQTDGVPEGSEQFSWNGEKGNASAWGLDTEGSGQGTTVQVANASTLLTNGDFENWSSNTPSSWTIDNGAATTNIVQESTNFYRGTYGLKMLGDGAAATIQISQAPTLSSLKPRKRYCVTFRYKASATDSAAQTFTVKFTGTGYTAGSSEKVTVTGDVYPTTWTHGYFFINLPSTLPSDFKLVIQQTGTPASGKIMYVDSLAFKAVDWNNGINLFIPAGATRFVRGDYFTLPVTNNDAGVIQKFARRQWGIQLPSSGSPTISDTLAQ